LPSFIYKKYSETQFVNIEIDGCLPPLSSGALIAATEGSAQYDLRLPEGFGSKTQIIGAQ